MKIHILLAGAGLIVLATGTAGAQVQPSSSLPTAPDASSVANGSRQQQQDYNRLIGGMDQRPSSNAAKPNGGVTKVTAADIKVGAALRDLTGQPLGKVAQVDADGVVVDTGQLRIKVPLIAFGKDSNGLLLGITAQKFNELTSKAHAQGTTTTPTKPEPRPATVADIAKGADLRDVEGKPVGKITFVSADGATIDMGKTKVKLPIEDFGVDSSGLVLPITVQKLNQMIADSRAAAGQKH